MSELKTLKDIGIWLRDYDITDILNRVNMGEEGVDYVVPVNNLKAEAMKWIKLRDEIIKAKKGIEDINQIETELIFAIPWIKHFFNITEQDLQEKKAEK